MRSAVILRRGGCDVVVVGAGAAGLAAAEALSRGGASVVLLEARPRIGGRVWTQRVRGWPLPIELGAEFVHGRNDDLLTIAREAGLLVGRLPGFHVERTPSGWKRMHAVWRKFDAITRTMRRTGRDRSVADFLRAHRTLSSGKKRFVRGIVESYHAAVLERASERALSTAGDPPFEEDEESQFRVLSGYDGVTNWLRSRIDPEKCRIFLSTPVARIRWRRGDVHVSTADGREISARRAIVTVPVGVLKEDPAAVGGIAFDPDPPALRRALARIEMGRVERWVLRFREPFWEDATGGEPGFFHDWRGAAFPTWWSAAPTEIPMITGWAGGPAADALVNLSRRTILDRALESLESLFGLPVAKLRGLLVDWHSHEWSVDPYCRGAYSYVAVGGAHAPRELARPIADTLFFAGEATEPDENGTVPGAIVSGRRAARLIRRA
jgi:monoamine oxidase